MILLVTLGGALLPLEVQDISVESSDLRHEGGDLGQLSTADRLESVNLGLLGRKELLEGDEIVLVLSLKSGQESGALLVVVLLDEDVSFLKLCMFVSR